MLMEMLPLSDILQIIFAVFLVAFTFLVIQCRSYIQRMLDRLRGRIPSGPAALPVLGSVLGLDTRRPDLTFRKWSQRYGKMYSFFLGDRFCIAVGDWNLIKALFKDDRFSARSQSGIISHLDGDTLKGIIVGNGDLWREQRRFSLTALRDFGFAKASGLEYIQREESHLLNAMKQINGQPFDPKNLFATAVANVVSSMLFSSGFQPSDPRFGQYMDDVTTLMAEFGASGALDVFPWLRHIYPYGARLRKLNAKHMSTANLLLSLITDHRKSFDPDHPRDYIDAFFCVQEQNKRTKGHEDTFTDIQLIRNLADLFIAGYETTTTFLRWSMIYVILNQDVQRKVQAEIDRVIGQSRLPNYSDKPKMPYTDAVTMEVHRIAAFVPFGVPHCAVEDVEFEGYTIPKGAEVWPLFCHHFMNPDVWGDPEVFRPERFLDDAGNLIMSLADEVQPFSVGRRACLGEPLARMEVFGFFAAILQHFTLTSGPMSPSTDCVTSAVQAPLPFTMIATTRS